MNVKKEIATKSYQFIRNFYCWDYNEEEAHQIALATLKQLENGEKWDVLRELENLLQETENEEEAQALADLIETIGKYQEV